MSMVESLEARQLFSVDVAVTYSTYPDGSTKATQTDVKVDGYVKVAEASTDAGPVWRISDGLVSRDYAFTEIINIVGGAGADVIEFTSQTTSIFAELRGDNGDDTFVLDNAGGFITARGGNGRDTFCVWNGQGTDVYGDNGDDEFIVHNGSVNIYGGRGE